jgi:hypothetical protein
MTTDRNDFIVPSAKAAFSIGLIIARPDVTFPSGAICKLEIRQFGGSPAAWRPASCAVSHAGGLHVACTDAPTLPTEVVGQCCLPGEWLCERLLRAPVVPVQDGGVGQGPRGRMR